MTQEQKELLLKDLCARLPYSVKLSVQSWDEREMEYIDRVDVLYSANGDEYIKTVSEDYDFSIEDIKPYLFPLSSMTEEQKKELFKFCEFYIQENGEGKNEEVYGIEIARRPDPVYCYDHTFRIWGIDMRAIDWFLKNHFDIYGLIPMGLALDATGLNIY
jgi:hypothetical protein